MKYIIAQMIGVLAFTILLIAYHKHKKEKIIGITIVANILNIIHYLLLGASTGFITKVIAIIRDLIVYIKDKYKFFSSKIIFHIFIIVYIILMITTYINLIDTFPLLAALIYLVFIWNGDELTIKKTVVVTDILWLLYNIYVLSIPGVIFKIISLISNIIAVINELIIKHSKN